MDELLSDREPFSRRFNDEAFWRQRADYARKLAERTTHPEARLIILRLAAKFDAVAATRRPGPINI